MRTWDVIVVGTGPAGAAAARAAATAGKQVLLLERAEVPRYKRCGGGLIGLSQQAVRETGLDLAPLYKDHVHRITFTLNGKRARRLNGPRFLPMVLRADFDAALVQAAIAAGAVLRTGVTANSYDEAGDIVTVGTSAGPERARVVVAADGSQGRAAAYVGVVCSQVDIGLEAEIPTPTPADSDWDGHVLIDWGPVPGSYGWVFPKGDSLTVGVIGDRAKGGEMRAYYRSFVAGLGLDISTAEHDGGHLTRVRTPDSPLRRGRVLVAGDAAGLLDPWTREGISYALRSGAIAGAAAAREHTTYESRVLAALDPDMAVGRSALAAFSRYPWGYQMLLGLPVVQRLFIRVVSGDTTMHQVLSKRPVALLIKLALR